MTFLGMEYFIVSSHHKVLLFKTLMTFLTFVAEQLHVVLLAVCLALPDKAGLGFIKELLTLITLKLVDQLIIRPTW